MGRSLKCSLSFLHIIIICKNVRPKLGTTRKWDWAGVLRDAFVLEVLTVFMFL